jgi:hypothetical protein
VLDRYEERYRLTIGAALGLASIFALILGIIVHLWAIFVPVARGWHQRPVIGPALQWLNRHLPW